MADRSRWFVSTDWLADHLGDPEVVVIDGSWHLPTAGRDPRAEYDAAHIPGAVFFDIDGIVDPASTLPHMLPTPEGFAAAVGALGIDETQTIVVYEAGAMFSAPRVRWMFRTMGAPKVFVLDGGLAKWTAEGRPVDDKPVARPARTFKPTFNPAAVFDRAGVRERLAEGAIELVDARAAARFLGEAPEPRPGIRSGHMPGSRNLPFGDLLEDGRMRDADAIAATFAEAGVDLSKPVVTSCGSGVTAAVLSLALEMIGVEKTGLYDGSWAEWGGSDDTPVVTGPEP